ncbi:hypothetical protein 2L372D_178 [Aeromonas phage 2L372D]|uniref:Uncharacterized protein n=1 Tax=Aeromonas phage 2L372D TaxID=2588097 RepID=A0A4Y5TXH2_9CAUD|nr:hypothetical protein HWC25_gp178 [Aeromonas phage 2L372D]QDB74092.1 hypothetical protein 2L372D_178 [Aeromonas phage 2L372D]
MQVRKVGATTYKVTCKICSQDPELFPLGYFISTKYNLKKGKKPCGCAKSCRWSEEQYLVRVRRVAETKFIKVNGFAEEFKGNNTRINCECLKDGYKWKPIINTILRKSHGCPKCANHVIITEQEALSTCKKLCEEMNYEFLGFPGGYKTQESRFEYKCPKHGLQNVMYEPFVKRGYRCWGCAKEMTNGNGFYPERAEEQDFLYVLNFDDKFIKVGRSFDVDERIKDLKKPSVSGIKNIVKLRIFTATHQEIYDYEQELHNELRERNFQHYVDWSTECFENDCRFILNKLLDQCSLEEVYCEQRRRNL